MCRRIPASVGIVLLRHCRFSFWLQFCWPGSALVDCFSRAFIAPKHVAFLVAPVKIRKPRSLSLYRF